ncbi:GAF and HD-GYP domain-containing protein [Sulfuriflexus sp.]|uniref:GAF and HD-GYP domain-containing protein n=1 Tax=Sulfuriflexus sp. TaxID=2015443 RepID=UPI0028CC23E2|nr:HD domain-containing phosphohydrolase [Sulfuriflexus sp.]MDT8405090.1 HD domain-containing phosphohydrolase [Sulfuriflexus sp.]
MPESATATNTISRTEKLIDIGIALSVEKDKARLLEKILIEAQDLTAADAGTLYLLNDEDQLSFEILRNTSLNIALGGSTGQSIQLAPVPLYDDTGQANSQTVAAHAALTGQTINIQDAYKAEGFDFSGTRRYDKKMGYHSRSFLTVPMKNHENRIIGVLQLINATEPKSGDTREFSAEDQHLTESLASQAAVALSNQYLLRDLRILLERFIEVIATAIDEKSPYTGGHCRRVPEIAMLLAEAVHNTGQGPFADLRFSEEEMYELKIAALMHDCGKITTPVHVVDKATKLETIFDRIQLVEDRITIIKRDAEITLLKQLAECNDAQQADELKQQHATLLAELDEELTFLGKCNIGSEFMREEDQQRVRQIARREYRDNHGQRQPLLTEEELYNLTIQKGTLTPEERNIINHHIVATINMLEKLPFPAHLRNVPEIAGGHHETMDGRGYPRGLSREDMSVQARIMGIADIFEALTAADRPYKKAMPVAQALGILERMKEDQHIDPDLFDVFVEQKVFTRYAKDFLEASQQDTDSPEQAFAANPSPR